MTKKIKSTVKWYATKTNSGNQAFSQGLVVNESDGRNIAVSYDPKDAPLLAAAPDLLAACEGMFEVIEARVRNAEISGWKEKLQAGRDAISKAKGQP